MDVKPSRFSSNSSCHLLTCILAVLTMILGRSVAISSLQIV